MGIASRFFQFIWIRVLEKYLFILNQLIRRITVYFFINQILEDSNYLFLFPLYV